MPKDGNATRTRIMDAAEKLMLQQGYAATSVDRLLEAAGITKGTFFYHFPSKRELAGALVRRWAINDVALLDEYLARARRLGRDPLQQFMVFIGLFEEMFELPPTEQPGCLYASFCYEAELMDEELATIMREAFDTWRERLGALLDEAKRTHPPRLNVDSAELVDLFNAIIEGTFVTSRIYGDPGMIGVQLGHFRNYIELLFGKSE